MSKSAMQIALERAVAQAGGQAALGRAIGCTQGAIWHMLKTGALSTKYVLKAEATTGISRHELRPDIYPRDEAPPAQATSGLELAR